MRLIQKRGPFQVIDVLLERPSGQEIVELQKRYQRVAILTHEPLELPSGFRLRQKKTPNIYLEDSVDEIFHRFRDTVRNEISRTERLPGFEVRLPDAGHDAAYPLYRQFEFAQGRAPITRTEFDVYTVAGAYFSGALISAITFFQSGDMIRIRSIYSDRLEAKSAENHELYKVIGYASKRLMFEICKYGKAHGARLVDLASINLTDPEKEPIARFKSGFGARIEEEYQYIYTGSLFRLLEKFASLRVALRVRLHRLFRNHVK